ncbi:hypothetical protein F4778DRAFT_784206 [Xylariomycetidae sp. FL2044]|nr:hypothetical protein F4778DRAFT_784206 [Xylariomycetidae sp. FL2044]
MAPWIKGPGPWSESLLQGVSDTSKEQHAKTDSSSPDRGLFYFATADFHGDTIALDLDDENVAQVHEYDNESSHQYLSRGSRVK